MDYKEATDYLYNLGHETLAMKLGLENISCLVDALENPQNSYSSIHVAGTNGKGSFCATLTTILAESNIPTGLFISPHLIDLRERFQYNLEPISKEDFCQTVSKIKLTIDQLLSTKQTPVRPTFFEHVTAIALDYFHKCKVKLAVIEVGLGGRLDSTNIISPILSVITSIDFDHQQYLGNTLALIAGEKAGILKKGIPALIAPQQKEAMEVIKKIAKELESPLICVNDSQDQEKCDFAPSPYKDGYWKIKYLGRDLILGLRGAHQINTAKLVIKAVEILNTKGFSISLDNIANGLEKVNWPGRLELLKNSPDMLLDGAHNPQGTRILKEFLCQWLIEKQYYAKVLIFSTMQDKDFISMASELFPLFDLVILVNRDEMRAMKFQTIDTKISSLNKEIIIAENASKALEIAKSKAKSNGLITISGSLHLIGEVKKLLRESKEIFQEKSYGI
jgi:dihydrofolate synthase/folylpolyglutamate synthase